MRALYICGSLNQTKMMFAVSRHLPEFHAAFTPYYCDGYLKPILKSGILEWTVMGGKFLRQTLGFLNERGVDIDYEGRRGPYDLVVTCSDLIIPKNIRRSKVVLVQEGMTDPESILYYLVKALPLPRWLASTATTGLSDAYDLFCVASEGYRDLFVRKGVRRDKTQVTGIPNFDDCRSFVENDFPYRDYVLAATSDRREVYRYENRRGFIDKAKRIADGRPILFKFHPNEDHDRARREVERYAPGALMFRDGNTDHMIANCATLVTRFSSVVFVALALGKEVHAEVPTEELQRLLPVQNGGRSAANIAAQCMTLFA